MVRPDTAVLAAQQEAPVAALRRYAGIRLRELSRGRAETTHLPDGAAS